MTRRLATSGIAFGFLLSGCGGNSASPTPGVTSAPATASPTPTATAKSSLSTSPESSPSVSPAAASARCKDRAGDADEGDFDRVDLKRSGDQLVATFTLTAAPPDSGTFSTLLNVSNEEGSLSRQLGVKWSDGELIGYFVFDSVEAQQTNLDGDPTVNGKSVVAGFPWEAVSDLGDVWKWQAVTTVDGEDADTCPEPGKDVLDLKRADFPS